MTLQDIPLGLQRSNSYDSLFSEYQQALCETLVDATRKGASVTSIMRRNAAAPKGGLVDVLRAVDIQCEVRISWQDSSRFWKQFWSSPDYSVEIGLKPKENWLDSTYYEIDSCMASLPPANAISRISEIQGKLGIIQTYTAKCISHLATQFIASPNPVGRLNLVSWLDEAMLLDRAGKKEKSLDVIFDNLDELLLASKFGECDEILSQMPVNLLGNSQLLTVLTATLAARDHLPSRKTFVSKVVAELKNRGADAEALVKGLE